MDDDAKIASCTDSSTITKQNSRFCSVRAVRYSLTHSHPALHVACCDPYFTMDFRYLLDSYTNQVFNQTDTVGMDYWQAFIKPSFHDLGGIQADRLPDGKRSPLQYVNIRNNRSIMNTVPFKTLITPLLKNSML